MAVLIIHTLFTCFFLALFILMNPYMERKVNITFLVALLIVLVLLLVTYQEQQLAALPYLVPARKIFTALGYALKPIVIFSVFLSLMRYEKEEKWIFVIPVVLNGILCFLSIRYNLVFDYTTENQFIRGPFNTFPFFTAMLYFFLTPFYAIRIYSNQRVGEIIVCIGIVIEFLSLIAIEIFADGKVTNLVSFFMPLALVYYYTYLYTLNFKIDKLTEVYTRSCYELDIRRLKKKVPYGIIVVDINNLKTINDFSGHLVGDKVLQEVALEMQRLSPHSVKIYRVGGDEFVLLWKNATLEKLMQLTEDIRAAVGKKGYTLSMGYSLYQESIGTLEEAIELADRRMYEDKIKRRIDLGSESMLTREI